MGAPMAASCHLIHSGACSRGLMWLGRAFLLRVPFPMYVRNGLTASDPCQSAMDLKPNGSGYICCFTWWLAVVVFAVVVVVVVVIVVVFVAVVVNAAVVVCCHCCCCCCCVCRLLLYAVVAFFWQAIARVPQCCLNLAPYSLRVPQSSLWTTFP